MAHHCGTLRCWCGFFLGSLLLFVIIGLIFLFAPAVTTINVAVAPGLSIRYTLDDSPLRATAIFQMWDQGPFANTTASPGTPVAMTATAFKQEPVYVSWNQTFWLALDFPAMNGSPPPVAAFSLNLGGHLNISGALLDGRLLLYVLQGHAAFQQFQATRTCAEKCQQWLNLTSTCGGIQPHCQNPFNLFIRANHPDTYYLVWLSEAPSTVVADGRVRCAVQSWVVDLAMGTVICEEQSECELPIRLESAANPEFVVITSNALSPTSAYLLSVIETPRSDLYFVVTFSPLAVILLACPVCFCCLICYARSQFRQTEFVPLVINRNSKRSSIEELFSPPRDDADSIGTDRNYHTLN
jgi:hypothetical protein